MLEDDFKKGTPVKVGYLNVPHFIYGRVEHERHLVTGDMEGYGIRGVCGRYSMAVEAIILNINEIERLLYF